MKLKWFMVAFLILFALGPACAPVSVGSPIPSVTPFIPVTGGTAVQTLPKPQSTATMIVKKGPAAVETRTRLIAESPTQVVSPDMTITINREGATPFLADQQGRSLYIYINDSQDSDSSACVDDCAVDWPPLVVSITPAAGAGVNASLLGTLSRDDGSIQATYNGWPLYYYNMDTIPGSTNGPSVNGLWFLLSSGGEPIRP